MVLGLYIRRGYRWRHNVVPKPFHDLLPLNISHIPSLYQNVSPSLLALRRMNMNYKYLKNVRS